MRRHLLTLALAGLFGVLATADAKACHKKKCTPACAPAPVPCVVQTPPPAPCPPPAPVCAPAPKKHCGLFGHKGGGKKKGGLCHKKAAAECAPVAYYESAPVGYAAPVYAAPQASPQASGQGY